MKWPWVSRGRLEAADEQIVWLRERVEFLEDRQDRKERFTAGMPEVPRPERPKLEPMPSKLRDHIRSFAGPRSGHRQQERVAYRRHGGGESWDSIMDDVIDSDNEEDDE